MLQNTPRKWRLLFTITGRSKSTNELARRRNYSKASSLSRLVRRRCVSATKRMWNRRWTSWRNHRLVLPRSSKNRKRLVGMVSVVLWSFSRLKKNWRWPVEKDGKVLCFGTLVASNFAHTKSSMGIVMFLESGRQILNLLNGSTISGQQKRSTKLVSSPLWRTKNFSIWRTWTFSGILRLPGKMHGNNISNSYKNSKTKMAIAVSLETAKIENFLNLWTAIGRIIEQCSRAIRVRLVTAKWAASKNGFRSWSRWACSMTSNTEMTFFFTLFK